jgi:hypothetical protein
MKEVLLRQNSLPFFAMFPLLRYQVSAGYGQTALVGE